MKVVESCPSGDKPKPVSTQEFLKNLKNGDAFRQKASSSPGTRIFIKCMGNHGDIIGKPLFCTTEGEVFLASGFDANAESTLVALPDAVMVSNAKP